jgi:hypothetical protein
MRTTSGCVLTSKKELENILPVPGTCDLRQEILRGLRDLCRESGSPCKLEDICIPWNPSSFLSGNHQEVQFIN